MNSNYLDEMYDDFDLYISIAKNAIHSLPSKIVQDNIFTNYRIHKKLFPKKSYYHM